MKHRVFFKADHAGQICINPFSVHHLVEGDPTYGPSTTIYFYENTPAVDVGHSLTETVEILTMAMAAIERGAQ